MGPLTNTSQLHHPSPPPISHLSSPPPVLTARPDLSPRSSRAMMTFPAARIPPGSIPRRPSHRQFRHLRPPLVKAVGSASSLRTPRGARQYAQPWHAKLRATDRTCAPDRSCASAPHTHSVLLPRLAAWLVRCPEGSSWVQAGSLKEREAGCGSNGGASVWCRLRENSGGVPVEGGREGAVGGGGVGGCPFNRNEATTRRRGHTAMTGGMLALWSSWSGRSHRQSSLPQTGTRLC